MEHTPGPWNNNGGRIEAGIEPGNSTNPAVATVGVVNNQSYTDTANARLIAAAPELLEALEILANAPLYDKNGNILGAKGKPDLAVSICKARNLARAAISKARGE